MIFGRYGIQGVGYKVLLLVILLLGFLVFVSAKDQSFNVNYNPGESGYYEKTLDFSSVMMKLSTENDSICKYDVLSGLSYSEMEELFDETGGKLHRKSFLDLGDGSYRYYVKCKDSSFFGEPEEFEVVLRVNALVTAQIVLSEVDPLNVDSVDVKLVTSKNLPQTPSLTYSYDGVSYKPLVLIGSGKVWNGKLIFDKSLTEGVLSFKFKGNDLEGRQGTEILSGGYFEFDRIKPILINNIESVSREGEIGLEWYSEDSDVEEYKIYRSDLPSPDYIDYYKTVGKNKYVDTLVESGKTYYYRVTAVDDAGNEGDFSREVSGTSLSSEVIIIENGLNPQFLGRVESLIVEIDSVIFEVEFIESEMNSKTSVEKELFEIFGLKSKLTKIISDLNALRRNVEKYKNQDLSREELDNNLNADRIKLGVLENNIPSGFEILEEFSRVENIDSEKVVRAISEMNELLTEREVEKSKRETLKIIQEEELRVESHFYNVEINYISGNQEFYSVVNRNIVSPFEKIDDAYFVESLPSSISGMEKIEVNNRNYDELEDDMVFTFETDTRSIFYHGSKVDSIKDLERIEFSFVKLVSEDASSPITGFSVFKSQRNSYIGILLGLLLLLFLAYYFINRNNDLSDNYFRTSNRIVEALDKIEVKDIDGAKNIYFGVKRVYSDLKSREKRKLYPKVESLYNEIVISDIQRELADVLSNDDLEQRGVILSDIQSKINNLPDEKREVVQELFDKIKLESV
jgi:hypothetical protein